ncbi:hypothetical protein NK638_08625 [Psychrobacter sp. A3]|uniref:hypothetical protein n=1 Tax=Psychrobacter sp. A3 TaxID=2992754 RepID=UPI00237C1667|nr:hypothetical protein [Psychrobacter sp. A3]MDE0491588.1 hypothetical protein [Psychrobacter sp. A3]
MKIILIILILSLLILGVSNILGLFLVFCKGFGGLLVLYGAMTAATVTISLSLYNHIDNIIKDIPEKLKYKDKNLYYKAIDSLELLKTESLSNTGVAVFNVCLYLLVQNIKVFSCDNAGLFSYINLLVSIFTLMSFIYLLYDLLNAFKVSSKYRSIIKKG